MPCTLRVTSYWLALLPLSWATNSLCTAINETIYALHFFKEKYEWEGGVAGVHRGVADHMVAC